MIKISARIGSLVGIMGIALTLQLIYAAPVFADTIDNDCLRNAARDRTNKLRDAQDRLRDDIRGAVERLERDESDALAFDLSLRQQELSRANSNFVSESGNRWRDYSVRTTDAWNEYNRKRSECYASAIPGSIPPSYTPPNYGNQYQNYYGGSGYGYGGYSSGSYPYGNTYPANYSYPYSTGYPYRNGYTGTYANGYDGEPTNPYRASCTARTLTPPPAGCSYKYGTDSNGCPTYTPVCNNAFSSSSPCTCPSSYSPVCTQDGRTYFNACYAACMGQSVKYQGICWQY